MNPGDYTTISFPFLGLELNPGRGFEIGPLTVNFYGLIIGIGLLLAVFYGCRRSKQFGFKEDDILRINMAAMQIANELRTIEMTLE